MSGILMAPLVNFKLENFKSDSFSFNNGKGEGLCSIENNAIKYIHKGYVEAIGELLLEDIKNNYVGMYGLFNSNELTPEQNCSFFDKWTLENIDVSLQALWFIKDHSISVPFTTFHTVDGDKFKVILKKEGIYSCRADGTIQDTIFTREELEESGKWYKVIYENSLRISKEFKRDQKSNGVKNDGLTPFDEGNSLSRTFLYLKMVRMESFLPAKIALYITMLENLLAVKGENTHSVAERVTIFISEDDNENMEVYKTIKKAYNARSNYVHGSHIQHSNIDHVKNIQKLSLTLDEYVRSILKKIILEYPFLNYAKKGAEYNFDAVNDFFIEFILKRSRI